MLLSVAACSHLRSTEGVPQLRNACPSSGDQAARLNVGMRVGAPVSVGSTVRWQLLVRNDGFQAETVVFSSGQVGDVVLSQGGNEVYRWSRGRTFSRLPQCFTMRAGHTAILNLAPARLTVAAGTYDVTATLAAVPSVAPFRTRATLRSK